MVIGGIVIKNIDDNLKSCSENKYCRIFENSALGIFYFDQNGIVTHCNENFLNIIGATKEEVIGFNVVASLKDENMRAAVKAVLSGKSAHYEGEYRSVISGKLTPIKADYSPDLSEDGSLLGGIGIIEDITELKMEKETLLLDESRLEGLLRLNQMIDASLLDITDFAREEAVRLTRSKVGYLSFLNESEDILTMHSWSKIAMEECKVTEKPIVYPLKTTGLWGEAVRQRKPIITNDYSAPNPFKKGQPEGHVKITRHMNVPIFDGGKIVLVAGVGNKEEDYDESDVRQLTLLMQGMWSHIQRKLAADSLKEYSQELMRINKELSEANSELKILDKMKNEFISNVSHELKTPLVSILGYSELVNDGTLGEINDQQKKALETVLRNSKRLRRLVDSLLYMSMAQAGVVEYSFEPVQMAEIIDDAFMDMMTLVEEKGLTIKKDVPEDLPLINGDKEKLTDLLINLIDNAVKFTPSGEISLKAIEEEGRLHIIVKDTGVGIPKEATTRLFQKFYQVDSSIRRRYGGTGLGLYISKTIVEAHDGEIWIESKEGVGTTVHLGLPK